MISWIQKFDKALLTSLYCHMLLNKNRPICDHITLDTHEVIDIPASAYPGNIISQYRAPRQLGISGSTGIPSGSGIHRKRAVFRHRNYMFVQCKSDPPIL